MILTTERIEEMTPEQRTMKVAEIKAAIAGKTRHLDSIVVSHDAGNMIGAKCRQDVLVSDIYDLEKMVKSLEKSNIVSEN